MTAWDAAVVVVLSRARRGRSNCGIWRTDADDFDLDLSGALKRARGARVHAIERKQPDSDVKLVEEAIKHMYGEPLN